MAKTAQVSKPSLNINILFPQGIPEKLPIKFLKWLLSYGRFIAIFVEVIVIATFVIRFSLDAQLSNLKSQIKNQVPFVESFSADEALIRQTQFKLATVKGTYQNTPDWSSMLTKISSQIPSGIKLNGIALDYSHPPQTQVKISGQASTSNDLEILLLGLRQTSGFQNISVTNISLAEGQIQFTITGTYQNG